MSEYSTVEARRNPNAPSAAIVTGYERILMTEVLPLVEKSYQVSGRGRGAGAAITPAALDQLFPAVSSRLNSQLKLLWISCGTADSLLGVNRTFK